MLLYEIIAVAIIDTPLIYLISSNFFFLAAVILCMLASYAIELNARHRFYTSHLLTLEKEKGTCFTVLLPTVEKRSAQTTNNDGASRQEALTGKGEHILFVDDETNLVDMMEQSLASLNYRVTAVSSPLKALELLRRAKDSIDLVITDFSMPVMNGLDFAAEIRKTFPDIPVILSTGYGETITRERMERAGVSGFIMKPLTRQAIAAKIRQALDQTRQNTGKEI